jgi:hypothetical protein
MLFRYFFKTKPHLSGYFSFYAIFGKKSGSFAERPPGSLMEGLDAIFGTFKFN